MKRIISTLFGLAMLCLFAEAHAVPATVSFTGRLTTMNGPVSGPVTVTFSLFDLAANGTVMWTETRNLTATSTGLVYADLGALTTLDEGVLLNAPLFLEIQVGAEVLTPRLPLQSVPYSIRSEIANTADTLGTITPAQVVTTVSAAANGGVATARSGNTVTVGLTTCAANQVLKAGAGGAWACAADTDTNTTYSAAANSGVALNGTAFGLVTCAQNQVLKAGATAGTWACAADTDTNTTYSAAANSGVALNGTAFGLVTCAQNQVLKAGATAGTWACGSDNDTTYTAAASGGISISSNQISTDTTVQRRTAVTNNMTCPSGQYMRTIAQTGQVTCVPALTCSRQVGPTATAATQTLTCPSGNIVVGGGCSVTGTTNAVLDSYPISTTQWFCRTVSAGTVQSYAICCDTSF